MGTAVQPRYILPVLGSSEQGNHLMPLRAIVERALSEFFKHRAQELIPTQLVYEWQRSPVIKPHHTASDLPSGAAEFLKPNNPTLRALRARYAAFDSSVTELVVWHNGHVNVDDIAYFRGDNAYVWQLRSTNNLNIFGYLLAYYYVKSMDRMNLLDKLTEDNLFGNRTFVVDGRLISRDLIDSILEIYFLEGRLRLLLFQICVFLILGRVTVDWHIALFRA